MCFKPRRLRAPFPFLRSVRGWYGGRSGPRLIRGVAPQKRTSGVAAGRSHHTFMTDQRPPTATESPPDAIGWQVVHWHAGAPPQPAVGAPCNGCGLCCLAQPCPLGMLVSRRRHGACAALRWDDARSRYLCGMVEDAGEVIGWRSPLISRLLGALARRWIAAGSGCDAEPLVMDRNPSVKS